MGVPVPFAIRLLVASHRMVVGIRKAYSRYGALFIAFDRKTNGDLVPFLRKDKLRDCPVSGLMNFDNPLILALCRNPDRLLESVSNRPMPPPGDSECFDVVLYRADGISEYDMTTQLSCWDENTWIKNARQISQRTDMDTSGDEDIPRSEGPIRNTLPAKQEADNECKICFDDEINTVLIPCSHAALCENCSKGLVTCPVCRTGITQVVKTFKA